MYCSSPLHSSSVSSAFVPLMMLYISSNVSHIHSLFAEYFRLR
nr:MAG TPA: Rix1 complex component involved in 60S ribosome maturation [Caudoviricetes sp.]